ncbi:hypothetical protein [Streptomyces pseudovenezuelae]|uniref:hypothetical protein n=1 Tax=Streptomyces pseudovenezuelae TaxID=67350 RepID=UPI0036EBC8EF
MNREQARDEAITAAGRAKVLARRVEDAAFNGDRMGTIPSFAQAGALWAETARAYAAIAALLPETTEV